MDPKTTPAAPPRDGVRQPVDDALSRLPRYGDQEDDEPTPDEGQARLPDLGGLLVRGMFEKAVGPSLLRRLHTPSVAVCICATVPDATWEQPLRQAMCTFGRPVHVLFRDVGSRRLIEQNMIETHIRSLQMGSVVICASQDLHLGIPLEFRSVSDATIDLAPPSADVIAGVIASLDEGGHGRPDVPPDLGRGLTLREVSACLRADEAAGKMVARLRRAVETKRTIAIGGDGPRLEDLAGYGAAAAWGFRLRDGVGKYRDGALDWRRLDSRAILFGPPGTGKSLFAAALSRSIGAACLHTSVGEWFARNPGDLGPIIKAASGVFEEARAAARSHGVAVLFLDEVDGLPDRTALDGDRGSWWRPLVNHVLALIDGDGTDLDGIVLLAATNFIQSVDPALLRPGRFGSHIQVLPPDLEGLASIVAFHLGGASCPVQKESLMGLLRPLVGATPARAAQWARDALERARQDNRDVDLRDIAAVALPPDGRPAWVRRRIAAHEAGHAVAGALLAEGRLISASIVATPFTNGSTTFEGRFDAVLSRHEIESGIIVLLAGRAADVVIGDGASAGAGGAGDGADISDLGKATSLLLAVHANYGMGPTLRHRGIALRETMHHDGELTRLVEADLQRLMRRAEGLVRDNVAAVRAVADALLARGYLSADEVMGIVDVANDPDMARHGPAP